MSPKTLGEWVRQYRDEVGDIMKQKQHQQDELLEKAAKYEELEKKYQEALRLIGEKDLEISILRDMVKKKYPDWKAR
jgi:Sec-independent protein translocase protein TatA